MTLSLEILLHRPFAHYQSPYPAVCGRQYDPGRDLNKAAADHLTAVCCLVGHLHMSKHAAASTECLSSSYTNG